MAGTLTIHFGLPGTGKTLFAMEDIILPCVKNSRPFFTNISGISLSGLGAVANVHQSAIRYYPVKDISDVIQYFDDDKICHDGVFVLDEMKDFIDNPKAISWLESRINVMRKQTVDFVLIAQLPEKEYIHPHLLELADNSNVFVKRLSKGDKKRVDEYMCDGGQPRIVNKIPVNSAGMRVRYKNPLMFSCYKTSESQFYTGAEDESYKGLMWYQTRKWKFRFAIIAIAVVFLVILVFLIVGLVNFATGDISSKVSNKVGKDDVKEQTSISTNNSVGGSDDSPGCFEYILCDQFDCKTDFGTFPATYYDSDSGILCGFGSRCVGKCERTYDVSDGGGLLSVGRKVFADKK